MDELVLQDEINRCILTLQRQFGSTNLAKTRALPYVLTERGFLK